MPPRDSAPAGAPCWIELFTADTDAGCRFYEKLFGWSSESAGEDFGGYINFSKDDVRVAGCMRNDGTGGVPNLWSIYLAAPDAAATVAAAEAHGAQVQVPLMQVGDLGAMAVVTDAGGATVGLWQPGTHKGFGVVGEPGSPAWFELYTRDYEATVQFYTDIFGWDAHKGDNPEFAYTTLGEGEGALAGIMDASGFLPEGVAPHWSVYFAVEDADATLARVVELGGSVTRPAEDTPYGRLAVASDPTGAAFKLMARR